MKIRRLGIDVGGVITDRTNDNTDTSFFSDNFLNTTAVPGAIEVIARITREKFRKENIFIVSTCGEAIEKKTRAWLKHRNFYKLTGMEENQVYFCRKRQDKAGICASLGITHFIDDHLEVLGYLAGIVETRFLFAPSEKEMARYKKDPEDIVIVSGWDEMFRVI